MITLKGVSKNMKILIVIFSLFCFFGCAHRGAELSEQIPVEFIKKMNSKARAGFALIGVIEAGKKFSKENIQFINPEAKNNFVANNNVPFYYQLADSSGISQEFNLALKEKVSSDTTAYHQGSSNQEMNIRNFELVFSKNNENKNAILIYSQSDVPFKLNGRNINPNQMIAH